MLCKHKWKVLSETTTDSLAARQGNITGKISSPRNTDQSKVLYGCKHILVVTCECCGKLKRYVENI
jgi:hypothetical protein